MVNSTLAKLGMFERMVEEGEDLSPPPDILYPWSSPEILLGHNVALAEGDVYSLCCLLWELVRMKVPWGRLLQNSRGVPSEFFLQLFSKGLLDFHDFPRGVQKHH